MGNLCTQGADDEKKFEEKCFDQKEAEIFDKNGNPLYTIKNIGPENNAITITNDVEQEFLEILSRVTIPDERVLVFF